MPIAVAQASPDSVTLTPSPVYLNSPVGSGCCSQAIVTVNSTVSGTLSAVLSSSLATNNSVSVFLPASTNITAGTPVSVMLFGNPGALSAQTLSGTLTVAVISGSGTVQALAQVNFVIGPPSVTLTPGTVSLNSASGSGCCSQATVTVNSTVSGTLSATLSSSLNGYVSLAPVSNTITAGSPLSLVLSGNPAGLNAQTLSGALTVTVTASSGTGQGTSQVNFVVSPTVPAVSTWGLVILGISLVGVCALLLSKTRLAD
jgi:hypothetical protein